VSAQKSAIFVRGCKATTGFGVLPTKIRVPDLENFDNTNWRLEGMKNYVQYVISF